MEEYIATHPEDFQELRKYDCISFCEIFVYGTIISSNVEILEYTCNFDSSKANLQNCAVTWSKKIALMLGFRLKLKGWHVH